MNFIFLDLEVSGLLREADILEIAASVCTYTEVGFQPIATFQTLIKPTNPIPDNIQRLTGLTQQDFDEAPTETEARIKWQRWLEQSIGDDIDESVIIGHSIGFDIGFMSAHGFWMPQTRLSGGSLLESPRGTSTKTPACDTLEICKLFLPDQSTLNLEFLIRSLHLENAIQNLLQQLVPSSNSNSSRLSSHRALYDTAAAICLFNFILQRIQQLNLPQAILDYLTMSSVFPIAIKSIGLGLENNLVIHIQQPEAEHIQQIRTQTDLFQDSDRLVLQNLHGQPLPLTTLQKLRSVSWNLGTLLGQVIDPDLPTPIRLAGIAVYIWLASQNIFKSVEAKIHVHGLAEKNSLEVFLDYARYLDQDGRTTVANLGKEYHILPVLEKILTNIGLVAEDEYDLTFFVQQVDYYQVTWEQVFHSTFNPKLSTDLDFLSARIEYMLQQNQRKEIWINQHHNEPEIYEISQKLKSIVSNFTALQQKISLSQGINQFLDYMGQQITQQIQIFENQNWFISSFQIRLTKSGLRLSKLNQDFTWKQFWNILSQIPNLKISTYLDVDYWHKLGDITQMPDDLYQLPNDVVIQMRHEIVMELPAKTYSQVILELGSRLEAGEVGLVLGGQNSSVDKTRELLVEHFQPEQFLALGETGSLTKIAGRIKNGFSGLVSIKTNDAFILNQIQNLKLHPKVIILQPPYLTLNQFWKYVLNPDRGDYTENVIKPLRKIYLNSLVGQLSLLGVRSIEYIPELQPNLEVKYSQKKSS